MKNIFDRIHTQFARLKEQYQSDIDLSLNDGASDEDFAELETVLGFALPDEFKEIYRIHNGSKNENAFVDGEWLSIQQISTDYTMWKELYDAGDFEEDGEDMGCEPTHSAIKSDFWFNPKWIPLTSNGADGKMIDLDPTPDGKIGQIIHMIHDAYARELIAPSLKAFFEQFANDLENDEYLIHKRCGLIRKDDWRNGEWFNSQFESKE